MFLEGILKFCPSPKKNYVGALRIIQGGHLKIRGTGINPNMRGHTKFLGEFDKNRGGKDFRGPVTEGCSGMSSGSPDDRISDTIA